MEYQVNKVATQELWKSGETNETSGRMQLEHCWRTRTPDRERQMMLGKSFVLQQTNNDLRDDDCDD